MSKGEAWTAVWEGAGYETWGHSGQSAIWESGFPNTIDEEYIPVREEDEAYFVSEDESEEEGETTLSARERFKDKPLEELTEDEITLLFDESFADFLDLVREHSDEGKLTTFADIEGADIIPEQFSSDDFEARVHSYISDAELSSELEFDDIKLLQGSKQNYYYSDRYQSNSWAKAVFLLTEDDEILSFVTNIRDESKIYPRPMILEALTQEPYSYSKERISEIFDEIKEVDEFKDIKEVSASNGDRYFYSDTYLSKAQAQALAEYYSVERFSNA